MFRNQSIRPRDGKYHLDCEYPYFHRLEHPSGRTLGSGESERLYYTEDHIRGSIQPSDIYWPGTNL